MRLAVLHVDGEGMPAAYQPFTFPTPPSLRPEQLEKETEATKSVAWPPFVYFTGKQSRSFANASGPEYRFLISACVSFSFPSVRSMR